VLDLVVANTVIVDGRGADAERDSVERAGGALRHG
jgi:hypothetical protein